MSSARHLTWLLETVGQGPETKGRDFPDPLQHDRPAHLRAAHLAVGERDRDLDDPEAGPDRPVGRLDLKRVAARVDRVEVDCLEHLPAVALEPTRQVADPELEQNLRVQRAAARDEATHDAAVPRSSAGHVAL